MSIIFDFYKPTIDKKEVQNSLHKAIDEIAYLGGKHIKKLKKQYIVISVNYSGDIYHYVYFAGKYRLKEKNGIDYGYKYCIEYKDYQGKEFQYCF